MGQDIKGWRMPDAAYCILRRLLSSRGLRKCSGRSVAHTLDCRLPVDNGSFVVFGEHRFKYVELVAGTYWSTCQMAATWMTDASEGREAHCSVPSLTDGMVLHSEFHLAILGCPELLDELSLAKDLLS